MEVKLTGLFKDHTLLYATECDGVRKKGKINAASSEMEAEASAVYLAVKRTIEAYPNAGEIQLHTDLVQTLPYIDGTYSKPQTDTMKKFLQSLEKLQTDSGIVVSADNALDAEYANKLCLAAFGIEKKTVDKSTTPAPKPAEAKPVSAPKAIPNARKADWGASSKRRQEVAQQQEPVNKGYQYSGWNKSEQAAPAPAPSNIISDQKKAAELHVTEEKGEWFGWLENGIQVTYDSFDDMTNGMCRPIYFDGHIGEKMHESELDFSAKKAPEKPMQRVKGTGRGWGNLKTVSDANAQNPFDAPKRDIKTEAFTHWQGTNKTPKPKWRLLAVNDIGQVVSMLDSSKCPTATKQEVEYLADWWEQVDKFTVYREGIEKGKNDFSHKLNPDGTYKGDSMNIVDIDHDEQIIIKDGQQTYKGKITSEYKQTYVNTHNDDLALKWAGELETEKRLAEIAAKAEEKRKEEEQNGKQMSLFDFMSPSDKDDDDPFNL